MLITHGAGSFRPIALAIAVAAVLLPVARARAQESAPAARAGSITATFSSGAGAAGAFGGEVGPSGSGSAGAILYKDFDNQACIGLPAVKGRVEAVLPNSSSGAIVVPWVHVEIRLKPLEDGAEDPEADKVIAEGMTNGYGDFRLCKLPEQYVGRKIYYRVVSSNPHWRVTDPLLKDFVWDSCKVCDGGVTLGESETTFPDGVIEETPETPALTADGFWVFAQIHFAWDWVNAGDAAECWDPKGVYCHQMKVKLFEGKGINGYYANTDTIALGSDSGGRDASTLFHEIAHAVVERSQGMPGPFQPCPLTHLNWIATNEACAWQEGVANWFSMMVRRRKDIAVGLPDLEDQEKPTWGSTFSPGGNDTYMWENGPSVEGRIAGALLDLVDPENEAYWDRWAEAKDAWGNWGRGRIWRVIGKEGAKGFEEFEKRYLELAMATGARPGSLGQLGFTPDVIETRILATLFQNTLAQDEFREPLLERKGYLRPHPFGRHGYRYEDTRRWSVTALSVAATAPPLVEGYWLGVSNKRDFKNFVADGVTTPVAQKGQATFVALNGAVVPQEERWYVAVTDADGVQNPPAKPEPVAYRVGFDRAELRKPGHYGEWIGAQEGGIVRILALDGLAAGVLTGVRVEPAPDVDVDLYLLDAAAWAATPQSALASSATQGPGGPEQIQFTPAVDSVSAPGDAPRYALVVVARGGSGSGMLDLYIDQTPPKGQMSLVWGPSATCLSSIVTGFKVDASDPETGFYAATYWTGAEPADASKTWVRSPGPGGNLCTYQAANGSWMLVPCDSVIWKVPSGFYLAGSPVTVYGRAMDGAGLVSEVLSATITNDCDTVVSVPTQILGP